MVAAGILAAAAPHVRGQGNVYNPNATAADTLQLAPAYRFAPRFTNNIEGNVSWVNMANQFNTNMMTPYGPVFDFGLSKDEKHYRLQDRREENKRLSLSGYYTVSPGLFSSLSYSDSRIFNRSAVVGGSFQDFIINDNGFNAGLNYKQEHAGARVDASANGRAMNGERTYKTDETVGGGINGGVAYNILSDRLIVQARGALRESSETSRTALSVFDGLGASEDSVVSVVRVALADSISFRASYAAYNSNRTYADQAQGALGGQLGGVENVFEETETRETRATAMSLNSLLWTDFIIKVDASHEEQVSDYAVQTTRFTETVIDGVRGSVTYVMPWKTRSVVQFDNFETLRNFGPQSVGSFNEVRKRASIGLGHAFKPMFRIDLNASTQLTQSFYIKYDENPRDRDQVDNLVNVLISSAPFTQVTANVTLAYSSTQFINIDKSQSRNNRTRDQYELRPGFSFRLNDRITISQTYSVLIEFTDYDYQANDNFLDRNLLFTNTVVYRPSTDIGFRFEYGLYLHDKGSYLPTGANGEDLLNVDREDRRNRLLLRLDYDVNQRVAVFAENRYSQFVDRTVSTGEERVTTDSQIQVGTTGNYDWGNNRKLKFMLTRVKRYGQTGSSREKDYWDMRSELNFPL